MEAASRIAAHLPNMNASSISFIRKRGEILETSLCYKILSKTRDPSHSYLHYLFVVIPSRLSPTTEWV